MKPSCSDRDSKAARSRWRCNPPAYLPVAFSLPLLKAVLLISGSEMVAPAGGVKLLEHTHGKLLAWDELDQERKSL